MFKSGSLFTFTLTENTMHADTHNNRRVAFTLAEVLITLGIVGVVSVLTLPNLMSDYRKKIYVAQLQRVYNQIQTAAQNCMLDEEVDDLRETYLNGNFASLGSIKRSDYETDEAYQEAYKAAELNVWAASAGRFLKKYFRVTKDCGVDNASECMAEKYKAIDGEEGIDPTNGYCVNVNTGATICIKRPILNDRPAVIGVDTNGKSGPNTFGRDMFYFQMSNKGNLGEDVISGDISDYCGDDRYSQAYGCFDKIIADGWKMNY